MILAARHGEPLTNLLAGLDAPLAPTQNFKDLEKCQLKIPKIWRTAIIVAIPKPEKPLGDPKSYHPMSLQCVPFKILERLIYARAELIIDPLLPQEQVGF